MSVSHFLNSIRSKGSLVVAAFMLLIPFIGLFIPAIIQGFYAEWLSALLGVVLTATLVKKEFWQSVRLPQTSLIFLGLIIVVTVQWMLGMLHSKQYAMMIIGYLLLAFTLSIVGAQLKHRYGWESITQYFAWAFTVGGFVVTLLCVMQISQILPNSAIQPTHIVAYLAMSLVSVAYLMVKQQITTRLGVAFLVMLLIAISALSLALGWLLITVIALIFIAQQVVAMIQQNGNRQRRTLVRLGLSLIPLFLLISLITPAIIQPHVPKNMLSFALPVAKNMQSYLDVWKTSWQIYTSSPWLGVGVGNVAWHSYLAVQAPVLKGQIGVFGQAHQQWLQILVELGPGGLMLTAVGMVGWLLAFRWRHSTLESWWLIGIIGVMLAHSLVAAQLGFAYFLAIFALLLGVGDENTTELKLPAMGTIASAAYVTCFSIAIASTMLAYHKLSNASSLAYKKELSNAEEADLHQQLGWVYNSTVLAHHAQLLYAKGLKVDKAEINAKLWLTEAAMRFRPSKKLAYKHALLLKLGGNHAAAVDSLKRTLNAYPMKITSQLELFPINHYQDYLEVLGEARPIKLKPNTAPNKTTKLKFL